MPYSQTLPGATFVTIPPGSGLGPDDALPWVIDLDVVEQAIANTNWNTLTTDGSNLLMTAIFQGATPAVNDEINYDVVLAVGSWTIEVMHVTNSNSGIVTVYLDATSLGTIDAYSAPDTRNVLSTVTGTVTAKQKYRLKLKTTGKNASSGDEMFVLQFIRLLRTA